MIYTEAVSYTHSLQEFGSRPGLDRISLLLDRIGNPQNRLRFIHIAGTNGKGSVTAYCASILREAGYKTGMFISPYVVDFRERFQIDGQFISEEEFAEILSMLVPHIEALRQEGTIITEFEAITALAFVYFLHNHCDIVCLEVGLGGTYDSTNVIPMPEAAVIMSIGYDHMKVLGRTLEEITLQKAGIIKKGCQVISYPLQKEEVLTLLLRRTAELQARLILPNTGSVRIRELNIRGSSFTYGGESFFTPLAGEHQVYNAVTAIETVRNLPHFPVPEEAIRKGLAQTRFPARFEVLSEKPLVILDGGHNPDCAQTVRQALSMLPGIRKVAVMGMMADKDYRQVLEILAGSLDAVVTTSVQNPRVLPPEDLCEAARDYISNAYAEPDHTAALAQARALAGEDGLVLICGSLYLAEEIRPLFTEKGSDKPV